MMCINQYRVPSKAYDATARDTQLVACGKCEACLTKNRNDAIYRNERELSVANSYWFITYTYSPEDLPFFDTNYQFYGKETRMNTHKCYKRWHELVDSRVDWDGHFIMSLMPTDARALCIQFRRHGIRYYLCGEYGDDPFGTHRPHYHALVYSQDYDFSTLAELCVSFWRHGIADNKAVIPNRIQYCCKDMLKNEELPESDLQTPNFHRWSNSFGLQGFLSDLPYISKDPTKRFVWLSNGQKARVPRYFKEIFFKNQFYSTFHQRQYEAESIKRQEEQRDHYVQSFSTSTGQSDIEKALRNYYQDFSVENREYCRVNTRKRRKGY